MEERGREAGGVEEVETDQARGIGAVEEGEGEEDEDEREGSGTWRESGETVALFSERASTRDFGVFTKSVPLRLVLPVLAAPLAPPTSVRLCFAKLTNTFAGLCFVHTWKKQNCKDWSNWSGSISDWVTEIAPGRNRLELTADMRANSPRTS